MKSKNHLKVGDTYQIRYVGYHGYDAYNGSGVYTGKSYIDTSDDMELFGFKLPVSSDDEPNWFPLNDIFTNE